MSGFEQQFRDTRREIDDVLADVPSSLLEARRLLTRELQFNPRPEELQLIVKIAGFMSTSMVCFELPRQMLALRVMAEREWSRFTQRRRLDTEELSRAETMILELLDAYEKACEDYLPGSAALQPLADDERDFLRRVREGLELPVDRLRAASVLAPRLELLAKQVSSGNALETFPSLSEAELEMFNESVHLEDEADHNNGRVCIDAVALRTIYEEYFDVWDRSGYLDDAELVEQLHTEIKGQLKQTEVAYRVLNERLQQQQDEAISASLEDFAEEIRGVKSRLFEAYLETQPLLREPEVVEFNASQRTLEDRLDEADLNDRHAEKKQSQEEVYLNALSSLRNDRLAARDMRDHPLEVAKRRKRRRMMMMVLTMGVLAGISAAVHFLVPQRLPDPVTINLKEFEPALEVIEAKPIGTMLYARVTDWDQLSVDKIRFRAAAIGKVAIEKELSLVYIVSDRGQPVAEWHSNGGVVVHLKKQVAEDVISATSRF